MMREILFRGQTRKYGEKVRMGDGKKLPSRWVYGGVLQGAGSHSIIYGGENENDPSEGLEKWCVYTDTLGQFTGLTDKNGKKIFEGDIIKHYNNAQHPEKFEIGMVWWDDCHLCFKRTSSPRSVFVWHGNTYEVIGNIHDNPELLEVEEDG